MPGQRPLLAMGFVASLGITFDLLACYTNKQRDLPVGNRYHWITPLAVLAFYSLVPLPLILYKRIYNVSDIAHERDNDCKDFAVFLAMGLLVASVALPITFCRLSNPLMTIPAVINVEIGNLLCLSTFVLFWAYFKTSPSIY